MCKVIGKIENFDPKKSYPMQQPTTKIIPVYGYMFNSKSGDDEYCIINYAEVSVSDPSTRIDTKEYI
jgi:hypothetical protein